MSDGLPVGVINNTNLIGVATFTHFDLTPKGLITMQESLAEPKDCLSRDSMNVEGVIVPFD